MDKLEEAIVEIDKIQQKILTIKEKEEEKIKAIKTSHFEEYKSLIEKRNCIIEKIEYFWAKVFANNTILSSKMAVYDMEILKTVKSIEISHTKDGILITFVMRENNLYFQKDPWKKYEKKVTSEILWHDGIIKVDKRKRSLPSFFDWFSETDKNDIVCKEIELIVTNPIHYIYEDF